MPYAQYGGGKVVLLLYCSSPGAQSSEGSLQAFKQYVLSSLNLSESNPLLRGRLSLLYFKVGPPIYIFLSKCLGSTQSVGSGEACVRPVYLRNGLLSCCPVAGQSEWLRHSLDRSAVVSFLFCPYGLLHSRCTSFPAWLLSEGRRAC